MLTLAPLADVLSAALDWGAAVSAVLIFFIFGNIGNNTIQVWWESTVWLNTVDGRKTPLIALAEGDPFSSSMW
jgi:hypothetical protein